MGAPGIITSLVFMGDRFQTEEEDEKLRCTVKEEGSKESEQKQHATAATTTKI